MSTDQQVNVFNTQAPQVGAFHWRSGKQGPTHTGGRGESMIPERSALAHLVRFRAQHRTRLVELVKLSGEIEDVPNKQTGGLR